MARRTRHVPMRGMVGRDFSAFEPRRTRRALLPALIALFIGAFGLVALRTEVLRLRYELASQVERESALDVRKRDLTVRMRQLREPSRLAERAAELGFGQPERVIDLPAASAARQADTPSAEPGAPRVAERLHSDAPHRLAERGQ